MKLDHKKLE